MATDMDMKVSIDARKCSKLEHVSPEMSVGQLMFVVIIARSVHQKVLLANQYIVTFVDTGFMPLMRVLTRSNSSYSTNLVNQFTILSITVLLLESMYIAAVQYKQIIFQQLSGCFTDTDDTSTKPWLKNMKK